MAKSLFHRETPKSSDPTPLEKIEHEIGHLKKKSWSVRHGANSPSNALAWIVVLVLLGAGWLFAMDPVLHAWDKGEATKAYLYLHNYGSGPLADKLIATQILSPDEVMALNRRSGSFQDYYASPDAANRKAEDIIAYMNSVKLLHAGEYEKLGVVGKIRYELFVQFGVDLPERWDFLDPKIEG